METRQRGSLLIDEMPSILKDHGPEFLHIKFTMDEKTIECNLMDELLLGEAKFDPFAVMEALDRTPAIIAFWSTLFVEVKEHIYQMEQKQKLLEAQAREFCFNQISLERPEGAKKMPAQAEVDTKFSNLFLVEGDIQLPTATPEIQTLKRELQENAKKLDELKAKASKVEIVYTAWRDRSYMLTTQASLMETLIKNELIKLPKDRRVYENWG